MMVSIIIVNFNTYAYTEKCIESIYDKVNGISFEIILVNNSSVDRPISDLLNTYHDVQIFDPGKNLGFSVANNSGISIAKGELILLLNSDTELKNDAVTIAAQTLYSNPSIGVVSSQLLYPDGSMQSACQSFPSITAEFLEVTRLFKLFKQKFVAENFMNVLLNLDENNYCDWVWGTFFMFRKADLQRLSEKKLSDRFFMYGEDMEWCYQFREAGLKSYYNADAKVIHHLGKSNFGNSFEKCSVIIRNEIIFLEKYKGKFYSFILRLIKWLKFRVQAFKTPVLKDIARLYINPTHKII